MNISMALWPLGGVQPTNMHERRSHPDVERRLFLIHLLD
jgi:hypothetical protein